MMVFLIGLLTVVMVLDCIVLIFLVLIQLPKKDAGAGLAFGSGATDALFGAGSGNALTKLTKYTTTLFFVLALVLSFIGTQDSRAKTRRFEETLKQEAAKASESVLPTNQLGTLPSTLPIQIPTNVVEKGTGAPASSATTPPTTNPLAPAELPADSPTPAPPPAPVQP